jgi:hypothetical protein
VVTVPSDSAFVADAEDDRCRVKLVHAADPGDADENRTIGNLLEAYPGYYRAGQVNVYLTDVAPAGSGAGTGVSWSDPVPFIILRENANAISHEMGHRVGLPHPYSNNIVAAGVEPGEAESRDSWNNRPFPDVTRDRLHVCGSDAVCAGIDAPAGDCRRAPGAIFGYCRNLKLDCAEDGDHVRDTPWDAIPCFGGVGANEGGPCTSTADCQKLNSARGTSRRTRCAQGYCVEAGCTTSADCDGGSWCAGGHCVNYKSGIDACCELHTDRRTGFVHNACWERQPGGAVVASPGVGNATTWPIFTGAGRRRRWLLARLRRPRSRRLLPLRRRLRGRARLRGYRQLRALRRLPLEPAAGRMRRGRRLPDRHVRRAGAPLQHDAVLHGFPMPAELLRSRRPALRLHDLPAVPRLHRDVPAVTQLLHGPVRRRTLSRNLRAAGRRIARRSGRRARFSLPLDRPAC